MAEFYEVMKPMVDRALISRFAKHADTATRDDLSQDILLKLMAKLHQFDADKATLFNWATSIVRTMVADYYRKTGREIPVALLREESAQVAKTWVDIDTETLSEMRAFFPFYVSTRVFNDLFAVAERYRFKVSANMATAIGKIFNENKINYSAHGTLADFSQFIVALYRAWMLPEDPLLYSKMGEALRNDQSVGTLRVLRHYLPAKQIAVLLHLCGGMQLKLPLPKTLLEKIGKVR